MPSVEVHLFLGARAKESPASSLTCFGQPTASQHTMAKLLTVEVSFLLLTKLPYPFGITGCHGSPRVELIEAEKYQNLLHLSFAVAVPPSPVAPPSPVESSWL